MAEVTESSSRPADNAEARVTDDSSACGAEPIDSLWVMGGPKVPEKLNQDGTGWETTNLSSYYQPICPSGPRGLWVHHQEKVARWYVDSNLSRDQTSFAPPRDSYAHALLNHKLYIMGGEKLSVAGGERRPRRAVRECLIYEVKSRKWDRGPDLLRETSGRNAVVLAGKIYLTTGRNGEAQGHLDVFDPRFDEWRQLPAQMITARFGHATAVCQRYVWVFGGQDQSLKILADTERIDPSAPACQWQSIKPAMRVPRTCLSVTLFRGEFYAIGGKKIRDTVDCSDAQPAPVICGDVEIYDPETSTWRDGPELCHPRAGHGSVVLRSEATDRTSTAIS